jgi:hypothetical protein
MSEGGGEFLLYRTEDGRSQVEVRLEQDTVWLTQAQMTELFQSTKQNISLHIRNIFTEGELQPTATVKEYLTVQQEGSRSVKRKLEYYNLDVIISVGYRVKSLRGVQFRIWATQRLKEYLIKGFTMDDERLKRDGGGDYFEELLSRIRDIRASEKLFWRKILDIYSTSIDYDPRAEASQQFFSVVQNKMHWAAHGHTAAEIIAARADAHEPNMGLTTWCGDKPRLSDAKIAKNYLTDTELDTLNRIVVIYLDFAELQALNRRPMHMRDWIGKLDEFLRVSEREILSGAGTVSHEQALEKARCEYEKYRTQEINAPSQVEQDFAAAAGKVATIAKSRPHRRKGGKV